LEDLIKSQPERPQAYLRLWSIYHLSKNYPKIYEIAEKLFLYGTSFSSLEIK
jgi:hypothetical protein